MEIYLASVVYKNETQNVFNQNVGLFSSRLKAQKANEQFVEAVLLQEYPDSCDIQQHIEPYLLDATQI